MLRYQLLHPEILAALGGAGHGSQILIADGNYPFETRDETEIVIATSFSLYLFHGPRHPQIRFTLGKKETRRHDADNEE